MGYNQWPICTVLGKMTDTDKIMHLHFGTDPNKSENPDSNPGSLLFQMLVVGIGGVGALAF